MEKAFDLDMFDPVDMKASDLRAGDRGVFKVGFMQFVAVCRVLKDDIEQRKRGPVHRPGVPVEMNS